MNLKSTVSRINNKGVLLVFPVKNQKEPASLWSEFYPRSKMKWEWDDGSDNRVADLWHLMKRLSDCKQVVYSKWYQGRATFFSKELFTALLGYHRHTYRLENGLSRSGRELLDALESDSPLSTRELKSLTGLEGKINESHYSRGMKQLFSRFLIVGFGESDDGAFPSLRVGSSRVLYEDLWETAGDMTLLQSEKIINKYMPPDSLWRKFFNRQINANQRPAPREERTIGYDSNADEDPHLY